MLNVTPSVVSRFGYTSFLPSLGLPFIVLQLILGYNSLCLSPPDKYLLKGKKTGNMATQCAERTLAGTLAMHSIRGTCSSTCQAPATQGHGKMAACRRTFILDTVHPYQVCLGENAHPSLHCLPPSAPKTTIPAYCKAPSSASVSWLCS